MGSSKKDFYNSFQYFAVSFPAEYVAHVEVNRPEKLNAFSEPMFHSLGSIFRELSTDPDVRCVILSGKGDRGFTVGLDVRLTECSLPGFFSFAFACMSRLLCCSRHFVLENFVFLFL